MHQPTAAQADILADLGQILGIKLTFDELGQCFMMFDERMVSLRAFGNRFVLYGMLGEFPEECGAGFWRHLMTMNAALTEGSHGALSVDEDTDAVMLMRAVHSDGLDAPALAAILTHFVDHLDHLTGVISETLPYAYDEETSETGIANTHMLA